MMQVLSIRLPDGAVMETEAGREHREARERYLASQTPEQLAATEKWHRQNMEVLARLVKARVSA